MEHKVMIHDGIIRKVGLEQMLQTSGSSVARSLDIVDLDGLERDWAGRAAAEEPRKHGRLFPCSEICRVGTKHQIECLERVKIPV